MKASKKRFRIGAQSDPVEFMSWLLNTLHADLRTSKKSSSIIHDCFQVCSHILLLLCCNPFIPYLKFSMLKGRTGGCERDS